ncbi:two-component system sensor histidine kinase NtrB [Tropicimonas isoalkanivorans]|uniref:histidine kinase n=1 Tax=Tropicimonas isoalkanivorans TaxID=441112 RepID=A0A1I1DW65_9RHOB|nr:ATP-binding protein [Tropicimonas isoalkanivorans]SFB76833.1 two-component system, NtrC family, nitrogen regulation sensor histidine kinase GlnL [Tropicimonas isoalkanivorans]
MPGSGRIWSSLPIPALVLDPEDRITAINPAAELFLNTTIRGLEGELVYDKLVIDVAIEEALARVRRNRSPIFVNDVDVGTGERAPVECNLQIAPMSHDTDRVLFLVSPREIAGRLGRSINADKAAKSAIGMAEMLAHEIKNPLAGITGAAQLLSMNLSKEDLELTDLIVAESRRIVKLLDQVEQFGNLRPPQLKPVNIHDVLERARKSASIGFAAHMTVREDYDPSLPPAFADGDQLLQVFQNLLKNAAQAAESDGGEIMIRTFYEASLRVRRKGEQAFRVPLQVEIIDNGPGLPPEISDEVFEPFVSGRENGTGLGLALVSKIIAEHKGWISVESVPGRTVFRISLPVAPKHMQQDMDKET